MPLRMVRALKGGAVCGSVAGAVLAIATVLAAPAQAVDEESLRADFAQVECDEMAMPGSPKATYIEESSHGPFLEEGNEWIALTLTSTVGDTEVSMPVYGKAYSAIADDVITEITLCQGTPLVADDVSTETGSTDDERIAEADQAIAGPPVETDGPAGESGPSIALIGGAALVLAGAGVAAYALLRRSPRTQRP